jgi:zinc protease
MVPAAEAQAAADKAASFPQEDSDLKADPAAHFGRLENGLRYVALPNREPRDRASLRLLVLAGSLNETDEQRGLAHFLEHMAFNGSTHYPPGTLIEFFQRMGMSFGADVNAATTFDRTVYKLELAHSDDNTIAEGLRVFSDDAGGLLLKEEQIEKERPIILAEKRAGDSAMYRSFVAQLEATLGATLLPRRLVIGLPEVINTAHRDRFVDFWNAWYRPDRLLVVVVGDFGDEAAIEKMIRQSLGSLRPRAALRMNPNPGEIEKFEGIRPVYHSEPESPFTNVVIQSITRYAPETDTAARRVSRLKRYLAGAMIDRRLTILSKQENAPFSFAAVSVTEQCDFFKTAAVFVACKPERWNAALAVGEQELRRALEHGFTVGELAEAASVLTNQYEQAAKGASTRHSDAVSDKIVERFMAHEVFTSPADELSLVKQAISSIKPQDCLESLRDSFGANGRFVVVTGNAGISGDAATGIAAAYNQAHSVAVKPPEADTNLVWEYKSFGPAGTIAKREHVDDLGIDLITFSNGARLNLKKTGFEANRVRLSATIGTGTLTEPADKRGLSMLASNTFVAGGLGKYSADDLRRLFAGKNVGWQFAAEADALQLTGESTPDELPLDLQLLAAELTDPGYRPESLRAAHKNLELLYRFIEHTVNGPISTEISPLLASGDHRFGIPPQDASMARTLEEVKEWVNPQLTHGALELAVVGDFDVDATIKAAAQTIGALPQRDAMPDLARLKKVSFPVQPFTKKYTFSSEIPKGAVVVYWPTDDRLDVRRGRRFNLLADVLTDRLRVKVREAIGGTYSPQVASNSSETYPHYGYISAMIDVAPPMADKILGLVVDVGDELKQHGVTEDEFMRAHEPMLRQVNETMRDNNYWLPSVLARAQEKPEWLDWARTRLADFQGITAAEISAFAAKYLGREHASRATIVPGSGNQERSP